LSFSCSFVFSSSSLILARTRSSLVVSNDFWNRISSQKKTRDGNDETRPTTRTLRNWGL
jgi:hypothetical protein